MVSGAWMATGGAAFCGLISYLFGPHGFRIGPDYASWLKLVMAPVIFGLSCCCVMAPLGAWLGVWLPERSRLAGPLRATWSGLILGAGIASLLLIVQHLANDLWMRSFGEDLAQLHELQEIALRQTLAALATVVPSAALWTGLWAYRLAHREPINRSDHTSHPEFC
jgi:MFS family permease